MQTLHIVSNLAVVTDTPGSDVSTWPVKAICPNCRRRHIVLAEDAGGADIDPETGAPLVDDLCSEYDDKHPDTRMHEWGQPDEIRSVTVRVPESHLPKLEATLEQIAHKAAKLGMRPPTLEVLGYEDRDLAEFGPVRFYELLVTGQTPRIAGWRFIAKLEPATGGNVVKAIGGAQVGELWRNCELACDHCQTRRNRKTTYILEKDGEYKQVGSSCLKDFTGHKDPLAMAQAAELLIAAQEAAKEAEDYDPDRIGREKPRYYLPVYLSWVIATIRQFGWLSRSKAENRSHSTADTALYAWTTPAQYKDPLDRYAPTEADLEEAHEAIRWATDVLDKQAGLSQYEHNLAIVCAEQAIPHEWIGIAASLIPTFRREREQAIRFEAEKDSEHVGEPGKRQDFENLLLTGVISKDGHYGPRHLHKFQDTAGNVLVWWANIAEPLIVGQIYGGRATVKEHSEYKGVKQTVLTRARFSSEEDNS